VLAAAGCENPEPPPDYVARVGQSYLTRQDLQEELRDTPAGRDSADARQQVIERWVTNELLYQEALRKGLIDKKEVQRLLEENKRSVLISALISSRFESDSARPSPTETRQYYERHRQQLALREPYVRVRHLATPTPDSAQTARRLLQQAMMAGRADSTWPGLARRFAHRPDRAVDRGTHFYPQSQLFTRQPDVRKRLKNLSDEQIAPVFSGDSLTHVLQLVKRAAPGTVPPLEWVEDEIHERLRIQSRKQMYARQVQRLRNEALAREALDVRK
jgi:parvulin-like peptidyl-prolyl isomerase